MMSLQPVRTSLSIQVRIPESHRQEAWVITDAESRVDCMHCW